MPLIEFQVCPYNKYKKQTSSYLILQEPLKNIQKQRSTVSVPIKIIPIFVAKFF